MNYTSVEQSKHLLELGLKPDTADMFWLFDSKDTWEPVVFNWEQHQDTKDIPCWSVGQLLSLMPVVIRKDKRHYYTLHTIGHRKVVYSQNRCVFHKEIANPLIDACYAMMIWLLENNYIKNK